tara:strand:+ start:2220 stop:2966 length:747 start_codon:yes stop_codon:yes gene_type:complete
MVFYRIHSMARRDPVLLEGQYEGASAFLVGANPRLLELDLRLMNMQGVVTMAINNAAMIFEPDMFISLDHMPCFNYNILTNPSILKLTEEGNESDVVEGMKVRSFPNTLFFDTDENITTNTFCSPVGPLVGWKNTFFTALHCLYQLGFKTIYLCGCTFNVDKDKPYAYEHDIRDDDADYNASLYSKALKTLAELAPMMRDDGVNVYTCHEGSELGASVPYMRFEDAISDVVSTCSSHRPNQIIHCNEG